MIKPNLVYVLESVSRAIAEEFPTASIQLLEVATEIEPILAQRHSENQDRLTLAAHWES